MNVIQEIEREQIAEILKQRAVPDFSPGDTVRVNVKVVEGSRERIQAYEGVCIARRNRGLNSSFVVRKISYGEGVERIFGHSKRVWGLARTRFIGLRRNQTHFTLVATAWNIWKGGRFFELYGLRTS